MFIVKMYLHQGQSAHPAYGTALNRARAVAVCVFLFAMFLFTWGNSAFAWNTEKVTMVWIKKSDNELLLLQDEKILRRYPVAFGPNPQGHKRTEGDGRTPEGVYYIDGRNPNSQFYKALHISYPNERDKYLAKHNRADPGGEIMIHGLPNDWRPTHVLKRNWTLGCIGMSNEHIHEVWNMVSDGTLVYIEP